MTETAGPKKRKGTNPKGEKVPIKERAQKGVKAKPWMTKSGEAVKNLEDEARETVKFVSTSIVQLCKDNQLKPGWALLGVCEFLALMVHQNMPPEQYAEEMSRFSTYIQDRLTEFNSHAVTH